jgi:tRNA G18 (ribose-2'-O)-methylase SpoU
VSLGHVLGVPFTTLEPWPDALVLLGGAGFPVVALTPDRSAQPIHTVDVAPDARLALAIGAEGPGLSAPVLAGADRRVRIPMAAGVDSLNVVSAAAVALHHFALRATGEGPG